MAISSQAELDRKTTATGAVGAAWDEAVAPSTSPSTTTYHAATLMVYSHADRARTEAIRASLDTSHKGSSNAINQAIRAAGAGRKLGKRLENRLKAPSITIAPWTQSRPTTAETDDETDAFMTESEWEGSSNPTYGLLGMSSLPTNVPLWLPYALTLVSRWPIFDLMLDVLRISWARHHLSIPDHSLSMSRFINSTAPPAGQILRVPAGNDGTTMFACNMPDRDGQPVLQADSSHIVWPLFHCLSSDNILTICEIALAPLGKVIFFSQYPIMLSIAVTTFKTILQRRGWNGIAHSINNTRDVRLLLEDPGPFLLGLNSRQRLLTADIASEILVVDLDMDRCSVSQPCPGALTRGGNRFRMRRQLEQAIGSLAHYSVSNELYEAFPGGRFRPFSSVEINGKNAPGERLMPSWHFDQKLVLLTLDTILASKPAKGLRRFFGPSQPRRTVKLDSGTLHVQSIIRRHATNFVDRRDLLEARICKLNRRLSYLITESLEWKSNFDTFKTFTNRLEKESNDLKLRLETEQKVASRLTGSLKEQKMQQETLTKQLEETQKAKTTAEVELRKMVDIRKEIQAQRDAIIAEVSGLASTDELSLFTNNPPGYDGGSLSSSRRPGSSMSDNHSDASQADLSAYQSAPTTRLRSPSASTVGLSTNMNQKGRSPASLTAINNNMDSETDTESQNDTFVQRQAFTQTMQSIQARLQRALLNAGVVHTDAVHDELSMSATSAEPVKSFTEQSLPTTDNAPPSPTPPATPPAHTSNLRPQTNGDQQRLNAMRAKESTSLWQRPTTASSSLTADDDGYVSAVELSDGESESSQENAGHSEILKAQRTSAKQETFRRVLLRPSGSPLRPGAPPETS